MMGMGPEALLLKSKVDPRAELAEYARLGYSRMEVRAVDAMIRRELEYLPVRRSAVQRLLGWGKKRLRHDEVLLAGGPAIWAKGVERPVDRGSEVRASAATSLAAMPAIRSEVQPRGAAPSISATLVFTRDVR